MSNAAELFLKLKQILFVSNIDTDIYLPDGAEDDEGFNLVDRAEAVHKNNYINGLDSIINENWKTEAVNRLISICETNNISQSRYSCLFDAVIFSDRALFNKREDSEVDNYPFMDIDYIERAPIIFDEAFFEQSSDNDLINIMKTMNEFPAFVGLMEKVCNLEANEIKTFCNSIQYIENNQFWNISMDAQRAIDSSVFGIQHALKDVCYLWSDNAIESIEQKHSVFVDDLKNHAVSKIYLDVVNQLKKDHPEVAIKELTTAIEFYGVCKAMNINGLGSWNDVIDRAAVLFTIESKGEPQDGVLSCILVDYSGDDHLQINMHHNFKKDLDNESEKEKHLAIGKVLSDKISSLGRDVFYARQSSKRVINYQLNNEENAVQFS